MLWSLSRYIAQKRYPYLIQINALDEAHNTWRDVYIVTVYVVTVSGIHLDRCNKQLYPLEMMHFVTSSPAQSKL